MQCLTTSNKLIKSLLSFHELAPNYSSILMFQGSHFRKDLQKEVLDWNHKVPVFIWAQISYCEGEQNPSVCLVFVGFVAPQRHTEPRERFWWMRSKRRKMTNDRLRWHCMYGLAAALTHRFFHSVQGCLRLARPISHQGAWWLWRCCKLGRDVELGGSTPQPLPCLVIRLASGLSPLWQPVVGPPDSYLFWSVLPAASQEPKAHPQATWRGLPSIVGRPLPHWQPETCSCNPSLHVTVDRRAKDVKRRLMQCIGDFVLASVDRQQASWHIAWLNWLGKIAGRTLSFADEADAGSRVPLPGESLPDSSQTLCFDLSEFGTLGT